MRSFFYLAAISLVTAKVQFVGINIAGFEFGCEIDGTCPLSSIQPPTGVGPGQMQHFVKDDQMNIFRIPVSWQFLTNNQLGATLNSANLAKYDQLIQACLATGAYCAIDIHNFARFNGKIIGQGGPSDAQFADLWSQLAMKYKSNNKLVFGLMNEPHDLDVPIWANSLQAAVTAIRNAGAKWQMILLPGTNFASAGKLVSSGSADALINIKNPDGSIDGLILDVHKYLDEDNSGTHTECTTDNIADAFSIVATFLRQNQRQALVSETGAGHLAASCFTNFCSQNTFLNQNSDVFLGYIAWSAGSFDSNYILSLTPTQQNGKFVDNSMVSQCVVAPWNIYEGATVTSLVPTTTALVKSSVDKSNSAATPTSSVKSISTPTTLNIGTVFSRSDKSSTMTKTTLDSVGSTMNSLITTTTPQSTNYAFTSSQTTINNPIESTINNTPQLPASMANKRAVGVGMLAVGFTVVVLL